MKLSIQGSLLLALEMYKGDVPLLQHVINVAFIAQRAARTMGLDEVLAFSGGLLHDVGKMMYEPTVHSSCLQNGAPDHPALSNMVLRNIRLFDEATIALMHHMYQKNPYPAVFPPGAEEPRKGSELEKIAKIVAVSDKMEAFVNRSGHTINDASKIVRKISTDIDEETFSAVEDAIRNT